METINFDDFKKEAKKREITAKITEGYEKVKNLIAEHPTETLALATTAIGSLVGLVRRHDRKADIREQQRLKDLYIYDRSIGGYWKTRRKLTTNDMLEIERRKKNGEGLGEILKSMNLLDKRLL